MRLGWKPNLNAKEMFCHFMMPDGSAVGLEGCAPSDGQMLTTKGLKFELLEPERKWRLVFAGGMERTTAKKARKSHVEFDLMFEALNELFDHGHFNPVDGEDFAAASGHLEQMGRVRGFLSTGLDDFKLDALGERAHLWGVHDWLALKGWTWVTCHFSDSHSIGFVKLMRGSDLKNEGFMFVDGRNLPVEKVDLNANADLDRNIKSFDVTLRDTEGRAHKVFGSVVKRIDVHHKSHDGRSMATMNEMLVRYTYAGKVGYGLAEVLSKVE